MYGSNSEAVLRTALMKALYISCTVSCASFTYMKGFISMMNELNDIAGQHEMIAENIATQIVSDLTQLVMSLRQDRKRVSESSCDFILKPGFHYAS